MTPEEVEAAIDNTYQLAKYWLRDQPQESGEVLHRNAFVQRALSPAATCDASELSPSFESLPIFEGLDEGPAQYDDDKGAKLIGMSWDGDTDADAALCFIASKMLLFRRELPPHLSAYISAVLLERSDKREHRRRGGNPYAKGSRDFFIVGAVARLVQIGFNPTRNRASPDEAEESACSIVAKALERIGMYISEAGIEKAWRKTKGLPYAEHGN
jgi:hypothetical protein